MPGSLIRVTNPINDTANLMTDMNHFLQSEFLDAILMNKEEEIIKLLKKGADVNGKDASHRTPLDFCLSLNPVYHSAHTLDRGNDVSMV